MYSSATAPIKHELNLDRELRNNEAKSARRLRCIEDHNLRSETSVAGPFRANFGLTQQNRCHNHPHE